jgi:uncharacterized protein DUF6484
MKIKKPMSEESSPVFSGESILAIEELTERGSERAGATEERDRKIYGVLVGRLVGLRQNGEPVVDHSHNKPDEVLTARTIVPLSRSQIGSQILLTFEECDPNKPVVMGLIGNFSTQSTKPVEVKVDEETLVFTAKNEIVLRCGRASITLTRAGKVLIRGAYLLSRSSGVHRIKGASVQIN